MKYRLYSQAEGGRKATFQHLRCDFVYEGEDPLKDGLYMIHPEFLDADGQPLEENTPVPLEGRASMWILMPEMRAFHQLRIKPGVRGHFMEGPRKIANVQVEQVVGLHENAAA